VAQARSPLSSPAAAPAAPSPSAGAGRRALAFAFDAGAVLAGEALLILPLLSYWWRREAPASPSELPYLASLLSLLAVALAVLLGAFYFVWSWGVKGATPGQRLLDLAVEGQDGRFPIGMPAAGIRLFGYLLSTLSLGVGFLLVPLTGAGLHDRIASTRVVSRHRETH
jgi:hypothetical protein